jgi:hemerythrin-like domain-containing protein
MLQINPFLNCTLYSRTVVHIAQNSQLIANSLLSYVNLLQNHIQKEENVLFKMADKVLSNQVQDYVYKQFEKIEEEVVGHGVHEQFHELLSKLKSKYFA